MRALQVSHTAQPGGSNAVLLALLRHAPEWVESACVFMEDGPALDQVRALGVPVALVPSGRARQAWLAPWGVGRLRGAMRAHGAEVVLSHVNKAHIYAGSAARLEGIPALWWQHEHAGLKPLLQRAAGCIPAEAVVCSARWTAAEQRRRRRPVDVRVVHPGVELAHPAPVRVHSAGAADEPLLGVVGRLARWKRADLAIRALPLVRRKAPGARLRIVGGAGAAEDRGYADELIAEAQRLGVAGAVELVGHVANVGGMIRDLDLLVHPAEREPWGLVLLEALAAGVPVVAADEGGPREIVRHGLDGLLVDVRNAPALAAALLELIGDPGRRTRMGAAGRQRVLSHFDAERTADEAWALVAAIARRGSAQTGARSTSRR